MLTSSLLRLCRVALGGPLPSSSFSPSGITPTPRRPWPPLSGPLPASPSATDAASPLQHHPDVALPLAALYLLQRLRDKVRRVTAYLFQHSCSPLRLSVPPSSSAIDAALPLPTLHLLQRLKAWFPAAWFPAAPPRPAPPRPALPCPCVHRSVWHACDVTGLGARVPIRASVMMPMPTSLPPCPPLFSAGCSCGLKTVRGRSIWPCT